MVEMVKTLKHQTIGNIGYNTAGRGIAFSVQAIASIILARYLVSDDYGIVGFALIFINFMDQFTDFGISSAVIQRHDIKERELYTGFTIKVLLGLAAFGLAFAAAPLALVYFDNDNVVGVIRLLALNLLINSMSFLPNTMLTRRLEYKKLSSLQSLTSIITSVITIILAINGFKFWSIVMASLCSATVSVLVINLMEPVKIKVCLDMQAAKELFNFGKYLVISGFIVFIIFSSDNFIIGAVKGAADLGYYALAFNWGSLICTLLGSTIGTVLFPTFSRMQGDPASIKLAYFKILHYVAFFAILANLSLMMISEGFLFFVLGNGSDKWMPALTTFKILCMYGILRAILEPVGSVLTALGHTSLILKACLAVAAVQLVCIYPAIKYYGIEGIALVVLLSYSVQFLIYLPALKKRINMNYHEFLNAVKLPVIAAILHAGIMLIVTESNIFHFTAGHLWGKLIFCALSYFTLYGIISNWGIIKEAKAIIAGLRS